MRVLLTGHLGYIGVEMAPALVAAGHDVVGLDVGLYDDCDFVSPPDPLPELRIDVRDAAPPTSMGSTPSSISPPCRTIPSVTSTDTDVRHQPARAGRPGGRPRTGSRRSSRRRAASTAPARRQTEESPFHPVTPYGNQWSSRPSPNRLRHVLARLPPQRDGVRRVPTPPSRHRRQRPRRLGRHHWQGATEE